MRRVLKPSGELIAIEYVRSSNHLIAWLQDLINPITCSLIGDSMNRETIEIIKRRIIRLTRPVLHYKR
jgi:demethylmenaquinone methyltransferase/2-methoxy-6-polyprenyl-1,4-benzoquinol methylase